MSTPDRLRALAHEAAFRTHCEAGLEGGHTEEFAECPHVDCVVVREAPLRRQVLQEHVAILKDHQAPSVVLKVSEEALADSPLEAPQERYGNQQAIQATEAAPVQGGTSTPLSDGRPDGECAAQATARDAERAAKTPVADTPAAVLADLEALPRHQMLDIRWTDVGDEEVRVPVFLVTDVQALLPRLRLALQERPSDVAQQRALLEELEKREAEAHARGSGSRGSRRPRRSRESGIKGPD